MPISVKCGDCGKGLKAPDALAGKKAKCPQCGSVIPIPVPVSDAEEYDDDPPAAKPAAAKAKSRVAEKPIEDEYEEDYDEETEEASDDASMPYLFSAASEGSNSSSGTPNRSAPTSSSVPSGSS